MTPISRPARLGFGGISWVDQSRWDGYLMRNHWKAAALPAAIHGLIQGVPDKIAISDRLLIYQKWRQFSGYTNF